MIWSLLVLCLAAFAIVAASVSAITGIALRWIDTATAGLAPRHRARAWMWIAALPAAAGTVTVLATLLPALGFGSDHCLVHDLHHPHLCPHHLLETPGIALIGLAVLVVARCTFLIARLAGVALLSSTTARTLAEGSEQHGDVLVFEAAEPRAFVLGIVHSTVHASTGLLDLGRGVAEAVLAHERAHARQRDLLWRALCPVFAAAHLPSVSSRIAARLATAQEMAADAEAADEVQDRVRVAEALVALARLHARPSPGLSFTHGDLRARVQALLGPPADTISWPVRVLAAVGVCATLTIGALHEAVHHVLETLLGALS